MGENANEVLEIILSSLNTCYIYSTTLSMMMWGVYDLARTNFMLDQMLLILSPRKLINMDLKKYLPTINFICPIQLKGWLITRRVAIEYGKKFLLRIYCTVVLCFISVLFGTIYLLLIVFKFV